MKKRIVCVMCSIFAVLLSSCGSTSVKVTSPSEEKSVPVSHETVSEASLTETEIITTVSPEVSASVTENTTAFSEKETVPITSDTVSEITTEKAVETSTAVSSVSVDISEEQTEEASQESETVTTVLPTSEAETSESTVVSSTAETEAVVKPVVVIPKLKLPSADGTKTEKNDTAEIDYSNADKGYISALYSGDSDRAKVRIKNGDLQYDHDLSPDKREYFPLMEKGSYSVKIYEQVSGKNYSEAISAEFTADISDNKEMYLYPNKYIDFDESSDCVRKAAELCVEAKAPVEKIAAVFLYITEHVVYDKELARTVQSGYTPYPDRTLESGKGICFDYASLFAAMCRSQGIPTRLVIGYAEPDIYHAWNEVYTAETGWITPELFLKEKGYNITDATFYAGNKDKEKISAYISDNGNYSAVYRY